MLRSFFATQVCRIAVISKQLHNYTGRVTHVRNTDHSVSRHYSMASKEQGWSPDAGHTYKDALKALYQLPSNAAIVQAMQGKSRTQSDNLKSTLRYMQYIELSVDDLDKLNIIHIAGTKGKGSTSAFCESILRNHGYRTGFFSSPHLVDVRERIRIDGTPISTELFSQYFWPVYQALRKNSKDGEPMPSFFKFLMLMAFKVFLNEKVDAVILEVGIGGRFDCTNIINKPLVCGITSMGIDHTDVLGDTIEEITWHKAGIFKPFCPAVTVTQPETVMDVLVDCARKTGCGLYQAPAFGVKQRAFDFIPSLSMDGHVQLLNASVAVQICKVFMDRMTDRTRWTSETSGACILQPVNMDSSYLRGLAECSWPGRFHRVQRTNVTYYLDGAHTVESINHAFKWFQNASEAERKTSLSDKAVKRVLLFNKTGMRSAFDLLSPLVSQSCQFDYVIFCPHTVMDEDISTNEKKIEAEKLMTSVTENQQTWIKLSQDLSSLNFSANNNSSPAQYPLTNNLSNALIFSCLTAALDWLSRGHDSSIDYQFNSVPYLAKDLHLQVFITGSLYLVGNTFTVLKEKLS